MIWIPILSVIVFALIFIPTIIYGFKKGWKGALIISVLLFVINFIMIGVGYLIYSHIWHVYRIVFFDRQVKNGFNFDHDVLKDVYQNRLILLFSFLCMPLTYLTTWGIHRLSSKLLTKHWAHKTKQVSNSEKQILVRVDSRKSKLIGGAILFANAIFWVSYTTSAVNVMTTPTDKKNAFNNATDWLSKMYGGGKAYNEKAPFVVEKFLKAADSELAKGLRILIEIFGNSNSKSNNDDLRKKDDIIENKNALDLIEKESPKAAAGIVKGVLSLIKTKIDPLMYYQNVFQATKDKFGNQLGYSNRYYRTFFINQLKDYLNSHPLKINFSQSIQEIYIEEFEKNIHLWKSLIFHKNINNTIMKKDKAKNVLTAFINERNEQIKIKTRSINDRKEKINKLEKIFSRGWVKKHLIKTPVVKTAKNTGEWAKYTYDFGKIDDASFTADKGILTNEIPTAVNQELKKLRGYLHNKNKADYIYKAAKTAKENKDRQFMDSSDGSHNLSWEEANAYNRILNDNISTHEKLYNAAAATRKNKESEKVKNKNDITRLNKELRDINKSIGDLGINITTAENELNNLEIQKRKAERKSKDANENVKIKTDTLKRIKRLINKLDQDITKRQIQLNNYLKANPGINVEENKSAIEFKESLEEAEVELANYKASSRLSATKKEVQSAKEKNDEDESKKKDAIVKYVTGRKELDALKQNKSNAQNNKRWKEMSVTRLTNKNDMLSGNSPESILGYKNIENENKIRWETLKTKNKQFKKKFDVQKNIRNQLVKKEGDAKNHLDDETNIYNQQKNKVTNIKKEAIKIINEDTNHANNLILKADEKIAVKNDETIKNKINALLISNPNFDLQNLLSKDGKPINNLVDFIAENGKIKESIAYQNLIISAWNKRIEALQAIAVKIKINYNQKKQELITIFKEWIKT